MPTRESTTGRQRRRAPRRATTRTAAGSPRQRAGKGPVDTPVDFTAAYVRRALEARLRGHGQLEVRRAKAQDFTIVHRYRSEWNGRDVCLPVAQLRTRAAFVELYWKNTNGRWVRYRTEDGGPFAGSLDACLKAIADDRWGCFWG